MGSLDIFLACTSGRAPEPEFGLDPVPELDERKPVELWSELEPRRPRLNLNLLFLHLMCLAQAFLLELAIHVVVQYYAVPPDTFPAAFPALLLADLLAILPVLRHYILPTETVDPVGYLN